MPIPAGPARDVDGDPVEYGLSADSCLLNGGAWLRVARKEARLTTTDLADQIGVHSSQISNYETGKSAIPESRVGAIAAALKLDESHVRGRLGMWVPPPVPTALQPAWVTEKASPAPTGAVTRLALAILAAARRAGADPDRLFDSQDLARRLEALDVNAPGLEGQVVTVVSEVVKARPYLLTDDAPSE